MGVLLLMAEITTNMVIIGNSVTFTLDLCACSDLLVLVYPLQEYYIQLVWLGLPLSLAGFNTLDASV